MVVRVVLSLAGHKLDREAEHRWVAQRTRLQEQVAERVVLAMEMVLVRELVRALVHKAVVLKQEVQALSDLYSPHLLSAVARVVVIATDQKVAREAEPLWAARRTLWKEQAAELVALAMGMALDKGLVKA